jgi:hypothetical protein
VVSLASLLPSVVSRPTLLLLTATLGVAMSYLCLPRVVCAADPPLQPGKSPAKAAVGNAADSKANPFAEAVAEVRKAMIRRDLPAARKHLAAAAQEAQSQDDRDQVDRLQTMVEYLKQFWAAIRVAMGKFGDAEEIVLGGVRAIVAESGPDILTVKVEGRIRRYTSATLPTPLVMLLVERHFAKDVDSRAVIATFLAVDPKGDRATARKYWQEAAKADIDTEKLLVELDRFPLAARPAVPVRKRLGIRD